MDFWINIIGYSINANSIQYIKWEKVDGEVQGVIVLAGDIRFMFGKEAALALMNKTGVMIDMIPDAKDAKSDNKTHI